MNTPLTAPRASTRTMRAVQMTDFGGPLQVEEVPVAPLDRDGAVVRVQACGVCRSDWHLWRRDFEWIGIELPLPTILGHEVGGIIEEVGKEVHSVQVGDRVTIPFHEAEGTCPYCRRGLQNLCDHWMLPGIDRTGGWAQYITVTAADLNCIKLPEGVDSLSAAAMGCRYMTAYRAVQRTAVKPGQWLVVHGCGGLGLSAVQIAAAAGALVVAVDITQEKLIKAQEEGALHTLSASGLDPEQVGLAVKEVTDGGAHVSIDALGRGFTFAQSFHSLRKGGRHVQVGLTTDEECGQVPLRIDQLVMNELEVIGSLGNPHCQYGEMLAQVAQGKLQPSRLVTRELSLDEVSDSLDRMTRYQTVGFEMITQFD